jgi:CBS domain-containing protein
MSTVRELLVKKGPHVASIGKDDTVLAAARLMNQRRIGSLVLAEGDQIVGIFTERDILTRVVAEGRDPATTKIADVMTTPVACCGSDTTIAECRGVMRDRRIRHLPVVDKGRLVGMITIGDLNAAEITEHQTTIRDLNTYIFGPGS